MKKKQQQLIQNIRVFLFNFFFIKYLPATTQIFQKNNKIKYNLCVSLCGILSFSGSFREQIMVQN